MANRIVKTSKIYPQGLTTIPKEIREALEIKAGDTVVWRLPDGEYATVEKA